MLFNTQELENTMKKELKRFAESMPGGEFINDRTGKIDKCKYIGITSSGKIFPMYKAGGLNPLYKDKDGKVHLSLLTYKGAFIQHSEDIEESIRIHNQTLLKNINHFIKSGLQLSDGFGRIIVTYHEF